jgi:hypothetical protein
VIFFFSCFLCLSLSLSLFLVSTLFGEHFCVFFFSPSSHRIRKGGKTTTFRVPDAKCIRNLYLPLLLAWYFLKLPSKSPIGQQRSFCLFFSLSDFLKKLWGSIKFQFKTKFKYLISLNIFFFLSYITSYDDEHVHTYDSTIFLLTPFFL